MTDDQRQQIQRLLRDLQDRIAETAIGIGKQPHDEELRDRDSVLTFYRSRSADDA